MTRYAQRRGDTEHLSGGASSQDLASPEGKLRIYLLGPFQIIGPDGTDLTPRRQKANALLALVAIADRGQRARSWLCSRLWSDRSQEQALGSLRQSLSDLRRAIGPEWHRYLSIDAFNVSVNFDTVWVDALALREDSAALAGHEGGEFLEGIDIQDDEFEEWLQIERGYWQQIRDSRQSTQPATVPAVARPGTSRVVRNTSPPEVMLVSHADAPPSDGSYPILRVASRQIPFHGAVTLTTGDHTIEIRVLERRAV